MSLQTKAVMLQKPDSKRLNFSSIYFVNNWSKKICQLFKLRSCFFLGGGAWVVDGSNDKGTVREGNSKNGEKNPYRILILISNITSAKVFIGKIVKQGKSCKLCEHLFYVPRRSLCSLIFTPAIEKFATLHWIAHAILTSVFSKI